MTQGLPPWVPMKCQSPLLFRLNTELKGQGFAGIRKLIASLQCGIYSPLNSLVYGIR